MGGGLRKAECIPSAALCSLTPLPCPAGLYPLILSRLLHPALPSSFFSCQDPYGSSLTWGLSLAQTPQQAPALPLPDSPPCSQPWGSILVSLLYTPLSHCSGPLRGLLLLPPPCICFSPEPSLSRWPILGPSTTSNISFSFSASAPAGTLH